MYYLRSRPAADAIKFTVDVEMLLKTAGQIEVVSSQGLKENGSLINTMANKENPLNSAEKNANNEENGDVVVKKVEKELKPCPFRRKGLPVDESCMSCGS